MNGRVAASGKTRVCPHCKTVILESASVCPGCQHHLRFDPKAIVERRLQSTFSALRIEGDFRNPEGIESWEYSVVVSVRNERGEDCLLYTSDAADERSSVDLGGRRIIKKKK